MSAKSSPRPPARPRVGKNAIGNESSRSYSQSESSSHSHPRQRQRGVKAARKPKREGPWAEPKPSRATIIAEQQRASAEHKTMLEAETRVLSLEDENASHQRTGSEPGRGSSLAEQNAATNRANDSEQDAVNRRNSRPSPAATGSVADRVTHSPKSTFVQLNPTATKLESPAIVVEPGVPSTPLIYRPLRRGVRKVTDDRPTVVIGLPTGWARALASGLEAVLLSWGVPVMCAILGFWMISTNPWIGDSTWRSALGFGTDLWALSLGATIRVSGVELSIIPLLWTALQVLTLRGLQMRGRSLSPNAQWIAGGAYVVGGLSIIATVGETVDWYSIVPGLLLVGFSSALWAVLNQSAVYPAWMSEITWVWRGLRVAAWWLSLAFLTGLALVIVSTVESISLIQQIYANIGVVSISGWLLTALQVCYVPNLAAFAFSWVSGGGFYLDEGMVHSIFAAPDATLPQLPVAALVPASAPGAWPILVMIGVGVLIGCFLTWKWRKLSYPQMLRLVGVALVCFLVFMALWLRLSAGGLGTGRLVFVGPVTLQVLGYVILQFLLPLFLCLAILHAGAVRGYVRAYHFSVQWIRQQGVRIQERKNLETVAQAAESKAVNPESEKPESGGLESTGSEFTALDADSAESAEAKQTENSAHTQNTGAGTDKIDSQELQ